MHSDGLQPRVIRRRSKEMIDMRLVFRSIAVSTALFLSLCNSGCAGQAVHEVLAQMPEYQSDADIPNNDWYGEERVTIRDYAADAMEIGISQDGRYLLFNDRNEPDKDLHWSERVADTTFQYKGKVKNTVSPTVDGTPSFDAAGNLYFTSLKSYPNDVRTIYKAGFKDGVALNPVPIEGDIYITDRNKIGKELWVSLDPDVSDDGTFLFYSEGRFSPGVGFPYPFKVRGARKVDGNYVKMADRILANINTSNMEYAPAISSNGLELFFSRIGKVNGRPKFIGIFVAKRESVQEPFSRPERIMAITGEVEAPVLSGDEKHLYYHRMDGGRFMAYRVTRKESKKQTLNREIVPHLFLQWSDDELFSEEDVDLHDMWPHCPARQFLPSQQTAFGWMPFQMLPQKIRSNDSNRRERQTFNSAFTAWPQHTTHSWGGRERSMLSSGQHVCQRTPVSRFDPRYLQTGAMPEK
jgi:hypothetical protein